MLLSDDSFTHTEQLISEPLANGKTVINGVALSQTVLDQLREAGINPASCNTHLLQSFEQAVIANPDLFEESLHTADNLYDALDPEESHAIDTSTFCGRLCEERQKSQEQQAHAFSTFA